MGIETELDGVSTVPELLAKRAAEHEDRIALIGNDGTGSYGKLSFRELLTLSRSVGAYLADALAGKDTVVWVFGNANSLVALVLYHAVCSIGATNVPINPAYRPAEITEIIERTRAGLVVAPDAVLRELDIPGVATVAVNNLRDLSSLVSPTPARAAQIAPDQPAIVLFTSGTTGRSKGVVHSHRTSLAAGLGWQQAFNLRPTDVYQSMFPVYSGAGLHFSGLACLIGGTTYVVDEPRPTAASLARIGAYRSTVYAAVPSIYQYWLAEDLTGFDLSSLRLLDFGGSVMHRSTIDALRRAFPGVDLIQTYGLTEAGPGGLYLPPEYLDAKIGSIGCVPSGDLRFRVDTSKTEEYESGADGVIGELLFAGSSIMLGYLDDPAATASVFDGEWMRTGDLVRVDADGFVYFLDRLKDLIIRGGYNISSIEIEETFLTFPNVRKAAAFGVPHRTLGEVVGIAIVPEDPRQLDLDALRALAEQRLPRVKVPAWVVVLDDLPVSSAGKVLKSALRSHPDLREWTGSAGAS